MKKQSLVRAFIFLSGVILFNSASYAQSKGISFQGVIKTPSGVYPNVSNVTITAKILTPNDCILREEVFSGVNIKDGYLYLNIGKGVPTANNPSPSRDLKKVMNNAEEIAGLTCLHSNGSVNSLVSSYSPSETDTRKLRLTFSIDSESVVADFNMRAVAYAVNAESLNGKTDSHFLNINTGSSLTQANAESVFQRFTHLDEILNGRFTGDVSGTASNVSGVVAIENGGTGASNATTARENLGLKQLAVIDLPVPADPNQYLKGDGTWGSIVGGVSSVAGRSGDVVLSSSDLSDFQSASDARALGQINSQKGVANGIATLNSSGHVPNNQLALNAGDIPNIDASKITSGIINRDVAANNISAGNGSFAVARLYDGVDKYLSFSYPAGGTGYSLAWPKNAGSDGNFLKVDAVGQLYWASDTTASSAGWSPYGVMVSNASGSLSSLPGGLSGSVLQYSATGPVWGMVAFPVSTTAQQLLYSTNNNVINGLPTTNDAVLITNSSGVPGWSVLSNDNFVQYVLLAGRAGGQVLKGGTDPSESLTLESTANSVKGNVLINPNGGNVGIGTSAPGAKLEVAGQVKITGGNPGVGKVLTSNAAGLAAWEAPAVNPGTVTTVSSGNAYLTVTNGSSAPVVTAQVGTGVNTLAAGNDSRFPASACASGNKMRWTGSSWICEPTPAGTVTSVTSSSGYIGIVNNDSTPTLTANVGTAANTLAAGNDSRIVNALQKDGSVVVTGDLNLGSNKILNVGAPTAASDAATKEYVDAAGTSGGGGTWQVSCGYAVNGNYSSAMCIRVNTVTGNVECQLNSNLAGYSSAGSWGTCSGGAPFGGGSGVASHIDLPNGYFVMTYYTYTGNLGGLAGANATCLNELTNYPWAGKSEAQARGLLVSSNVKAFLCDGSSCNFGKPFTRYQFAAVGYTQYGGSGFSTDNNGYGPNDTGNWSGTAYFGQSTKAWTGIYSNPATTSPTWTSCGSYVSNSTSFAPIANLFTTNSVNHCTGWTSASASVKGGYGLTGSANGNRWGAVNFTSQDGYGNCYGPAQMTENCSTSKRLLCFVHP